MIAVLPDQQALPTIAASRRRTPSLDGLGTERARRCSCTEAAVTRPGQGWVWVDASARVVRTGALERSGEAADGKGMGRGEVSMASLRTSASLTGVARARELRRMLASAMFVASVLVLASCGGDSVDQPFRTVTVTARENPSRTCVDDASAGACFGAWEPVVAADPDHRAFAVAWLAAYGGVNRLVLHLRRLDSRTGRLLGRERSIPFGVILRPSGAGPVLVHRIGGGYVVLHRELVASQDGSHHASGPLVAQELSDDLGRVGKPRKIDDGVSMPAGRARVEGLTAVAIRDGAVAVAESQYLISGGLPPNTVE